MAGPAIALKTFGRVMPKVNDPSPGGRFTLRCMAGQAGLHFLLLDAGMVFGRRLRELGMTALAAFLSFLVG